MTDYIGFDPHEFDDSAGRHTEIEIDHFTDNTPIITAYMRGGDQTVWLNAYTEPRWIVETWPPAPCPGLSHARLEGKVDYISVRSDVPLHEVFHARVQQLKQAGYEDATPSAATEESRQPTRPAT